MIVFLALASVLICLPLASSDEDDLFITVNSGDKHYLKDIRDLPYRTLELPELQGEDDIETTFSISVSNKVPPETQISISKTSEDSHFVRKMDVFTTCKAQRTCFVRFVLGEESDVVLMATVNTTIQSYPAFGVVQKYHFNGVDNTFGHKAAIVCVGILMLIVPLALLYLFLRRKYRKEQKANKQTEKTPQLEGLHQNLQKEMTQQETSKQEDLNKEKDALNARIVALTKENEAQENTIKKMQNELHHEQEGHKTQTDRIGAKRA